MEQELKKVIVDHLNMLVEKINNIKMEPTVEPIEENKEEEVPKKARKKYVYPPEKIKEYNRQYYLRNKEKMIKQTIDATHKRIENGTFKKVIRKKKDGYTPEQRREYNKQYNLKKKEMKNREKIV